MLCCYCCC